MKRTLYSVLGLVTLLGVALAGDGPTRIATPASLATTPGGAGVVDLPAGTAVAVLERRGEWTRVLVEGWIPSSALEEGSPAVAPAPAAPALPPPTAPALPVPPRIEATPAPAPAPTVAAGFVEGTIRLDTKWLRKRKGAGARVWLVPSAAFLDAEGRNADEEKRLAVLDTEIDALEAEAARVLEKAPVLTEGTRAHDEVMARRDGKIQERQDILASLHGGHESVAQRSSVATTIADGQGWFRLSGAPAGEYTLYARYTRDAVDVEWIETVTLSGGAVRADLDQGNARHLLSGAR